MSSNPNNDPFEILKKLGESYRQIRFGRGVVGKTSHSTLAVIGAWALVLFRLSENVWLDVALIACGVVVTCINIWWVRGTQKFARENPGLALMEGAELLEYQKFEAYAKGVPPPRESSLAIPNPDSAPAIGLDPDA